MSSEKVFSSILLISLMLTAGCGGRTDEMSQAQGLVQQGKCDEAIQKLNEIIQNNPSSAKAYYERAGAYLCLKNLEKVIEDTTKAIGLYKGQNAEPLYVGMSLDLRAVAYNKLGDHEQAIDDYSEAIRTDTKNPRFHYSGRAYSYCLAGQYQHAIDDCNWLLNWRSRSPYEDARAAEADVHGEAYWNRGKAYEGLGKIDLARRDYAESKQLGFMAPMNN